MPPREYRFHEGQRGSAIVVRVIPRSNRNEIVDILSDGKIKIRLTAPPIEGKANQALINFLSDLLGVSKSDIEIVAGHKSKDKIVSILNIDTTTLNELILGNLKR